MSIVPTKYEEAQIFALYDQQHQYILYVWKQCSVCPRFKTLVQDTLTSLKSNVMIREVEYTENPTKILLETKSFPHLVKYYKSKKTKFILTDPKVEERLKKFLSE